VAGIVFDARRRVLLHRRHVGNGWAPPSGSVEPGETIEAALRRELEAETGLQVAIDRIVGIYSEPSAQIVRYPGERDVHFVTTVIACHVLRGTLRDCGEGGGWAWFGVTDLPDPLLAYARRWIEDANAGGEPLLR
jgi:8-oxo-dGTP pyrophosphatase MutT (NUDIX family)